MFKFMWQEIKKIIGCILDNRFCLIVFGLIAAKSIYLLFKVFSFNKECMTGIILYISFMTFLSITPLVPLGSLFSDRGKTIYLLFIDLLFSLLFTADIVYARAFDHLISFNKIISNGLNSGLVASIISLMKYQDSIFFLDLPFLIYIVYKMKNVVRFNSKRHLLRTAFILVFSVCFMVVCYNNIFASSDANTDLEPIILSPVGYHVSDLMKLIHEKNDKLTLDNINNIDQWLDQNANYQNPDKKYSDLQGLIKGKNLIVIQFESLETIVINNSFYGQEVTPNINKLLENSIYFPNIYEQVRDGNSSDAELMFNTAIYPSTSGSTFLRFGDNTYNSLPLILNKRNYISVAVHGDNKEFWNRDNVFPKLGFEQYIAEDRFEDKTKAGMGILDSSLFSQSEMEMKKLNQPFYCFVITLTSHMPFDAAEKVGGLPLPDDDIKYNYIQTINYTDRCIGQFINELNNSGLLSNSVVIIYGDHEGIHKYYKEDTTTDNNGRIPFIIYIPGMQGITLNTIGGQVDMMPTLAYLMGIPQAEYDKTTMGINLFSQYSGAAILPDGKLMGASQDEEHLRATQDIANLIITGNYFGKFAHE